jgi:hypothetical protein
MGSTPRSTRALEIPTTSCNSRLASVARSLLILSMCAWILSSSADRFCLSGGCMPYSCSSTSIASHTSRSVSCRQRKIWRSSNVRLRSVSCLDLELEMHVWAKKSCWTALAQMQLASCSVCTSPRACSKATKPSSHTAMTPSLLSSSLS